MKIAVTDASIFIDLIECDGCESFFGLSYHIVTSYQIWRELDPKQRKFLSVWVDKCQLTVIRIEDDFVAATEPYNLSLSLSIPDRSAWFLAMSESALLLTSDAVLRKMGKKHGIPTHGLLWLFDQMVEEQTLGPSEAVLKLQSIFDQNIYYKRNQKLLSAFKKLSKKWKDR